MGTLSSCQVELEVDLTIIGGGPTGLLTGLLAERLGVSVCIIDPKSGTLELGRADALNARSQQYLEVVGVLDQLLEQGITCNTSSTFADGHFVSRQSHWWTGLEHAFRKNFLMIGQPELERVLEASLSTPVLFGDRVVALSEDDTSVLAKTSCGRKVRSRYAVAADGARSTVRTALDIAFTGTKPMMVWAVLDTFIETDFPTCPEIITFQLNGQSRVSWIPRERGMARFYVLLDGDITQERAEESIREHMVPHRIEFKKTEWFSTFEVKERIASTFISRNGAGRICLAGDAAHVHSVNGGQGVNTGIADAFALAWRLASAIKSHAPKNHVCSRLIRSYDIERRTVAKGVIQVAAMLVRDTMHSAKQYVSTIERNAAYITGMGVAYDNIGSTLVSASEYGIWKAGHRCPDVHLIKGPRGQETTCRLYSIVSYGKFLVLQVGDYHSCARAENLHNASTTIFQILPVRELGAASNTATDGKAQLIGAEDKLVFQAEFVASSEQYAVVVRPDMFVGFVGQGDGWIKYLAEIFS